MKHRRAPLQVCFPGSPIRGPADWSALPVVGVAWLLLSGIYPGLPFASGQTTPPSADPLAPPAVTPTTENSAESAVVDAASFVEFMGISPSEWALALEDREWDPVHSQLTAKLLRAARRLPARKIAAWQTEAWTVRQIAEQPAAFRGRLLDFHGRVVAIEAVKSPESFAPGEDNTIYVLKCRSPKDAAAEITLICRDIPLPFQRRLVAGGGRLTHLQEQIRAAAFFLSTTNQTPVPGLVLIADHLAWYPDRLDSPLIDSGRWVDWASHGMDLATVDTVRDRRPLESGDRACFYELLATVRRLPLKKLQGLATPAGAIDLLQTPEVHRLQAYTVRGTARRAIRIEVDDLEIVDCLGVSHYFEIELFDSEATVRVKAGNGREDAIFNSYPIVCCVAELPGDFPTGDVIHEPVEISGVFLKLWAYDTAFVQQTLRPGAKQLSPLLIGKTVVPLPPEREVGELPSGWAVGIVFVAGLAGLITLLRWSAVGDRRFRHTMLAKYRRDARGTSGLPPQSGPGS